MKRSDRKHGESAASDAEGTASNVRRVLVEQLELDARVGVYPHEHGRTQRIQVWLTLDVQDHYDGRSDRLADVYDYDDAIRVVRAIAGQHHFNLLERLAEAIASACLDDVRIRTIRLRIAKPDAVPGCRAVAIEIERSRPR